MTPLYVTDGGNLVLVGVLRVTGMEPDGADMSLENWSFIFKWVGYIGAALVVFSTMGVGYFEGKIDEIKDGKIDELVSGKNALLKSVDEYKHQVEEKQRQLDELRLRAVNAQRNVSTRYSYRGVKTTVTGNRTIVSDELADWLPKIQALTELRDWASIIEESSSMINDEPEFYTPYISRATARFMMGDIASAEADLMFVIQNTGNDPEYSGVPMLLESFQRNKS